MTQITIDLQEGFENDTVVIRMNGQEVLMHENVSTRLQIGLADRFELQLSQGSNMIDIELPVKKIKIKKEADLKIDQYWGVTYHAEGRLTIREQPHEFWYA